MRCGLAVRLSPKTGADVGSRVDKEAAVGARRIDRVSGEDSGGATVDRHAERCGRLDRSPPEVIDWPRRRPCWSAQQVKRIGHNPRVRAIACITYKSVLSMLLNREGDIPSIRRDSRAAKTRAPAVHSSVPVPLASSRYSRSYRLQKHTEGNLTSRGRPRVGRQRDASRRRKPRWVNQRSQAPECSILTCERETIADRQRWPPVMCSGQAQRISR